MPDNIHLTITEVQADALLHDIQFALESMTPEERENVYLFPSSGIEISISFDSNLHPFLSQTRGLSTRDQRTQLRFDNPILRKIADALDAIGREQRGGRMFLTSNGVYYKDGFRRVDLKDWDWLGGDLISEIERLSNQI